VNYCNNCGEFGADESADIEAIKALNTRQSRVLQQPQNAETRLYLAAANCTWGYITLFDEYGAQPQLLTT
jgi:hypothetical protein